MYAIKSALQMAAASNHGPVTDLLPTHYLSVHQSAIRAVAWIRAPPSWPSGKSRFDQGPTMIASTGYDGVECITDIREGRGAIMNRTRGTLSDCALPLKDLLISLLKKLSTRQCTHLSLAGQLQWIMKMPSKYTLSHQACWAEVICCSNPKAPSGYALIQASCSPV